MTAIVNFVTTLPIANIRPFEDNPYKVQDNEKMQFLCESIRENGVLSPLLVRKIGAAEEYEVISGHRRLYAAHKLGLTELPTVITDLDRNAAAIALMDRLAQVPQCGFRYRQRQTGTALHSADLSYSRIVEQTGHRRNGTVYWCRAFLSR